MHAVVVQDPEIEEIIIEDKQTPEVPSVDSNEDLQWLRCGFCEYTTKDATDLNHHESMLHEIVHCSKCEYGALDKSLVDEHTERKHESNENIATQEGIFKNSLFQFHICNPDVKFACESCTFISLTATELLTHDQSCHATKKPLSCTYCGFETTEETSLKSYMVGEHDNPAKGDIEEPSACEGCNLVLANVNLLQEHVQMYHTVEVMHCTKCKFTTEDDESLISHMTEFHVGLEAGGIKCTKCDFVVATDLLLKEHNQIKHMEPKVNLKEELNISCEQCNFRCRLRIQLKKHMQRYHEEQKFKCNFCEFQSNVLLRIYEHKISNHPDNPMEFQPNSNPVSEMVMNMLAEQNLDMMEEIVTVKTFLKEALETFADNIGRAFDEAKVRDESMKTTLNKLSDKI